MIGRAQPSGIKLSVQDAALIKGMLDRGDRQHDIAAWFGINGGRIAEVARGSRFPDVTAAAIHDLPPCGPYPRAAQAVEAIAALKRARAALIVAESTIRQSSH
jgi:hypothetical protein